MDEDHRYIYDQRGLELNPENGNTTTDKHGWTRLKRVCGCLPFPSPSDLVLVLRIRVHLCSSVVSVL